MNKVAELRLLNNLHIPRNVIISFHPGNESVITDLYAIIEKINKLEKLKDDNGFNQRISLSFVLPTHYRDENNKIVKAGEQKKEFDRMRRLFFAKLSEIKTVNTPLKAIYVNTSDIVWMQDLVECGAVRLKGEKDWMPGIFDLRYFNSDASAQTYRVLAQSLNIPAVILNGEGAENTDAADTGGNIEVTHEGVIYVGNKISQPLYEDLKKYTRQKIVELPTEWLSVGHVDEIMFFIPAGNSCGAALVYANPLEALQIILEKKKWEKPAYNEIKQSIEYYLKTQSRDKKNYILSDFDLKKKPRHMGNKNERKHGKYSDWFVLENLKAYVHIMQCIELLKNSSKCLNELVSLPIIMKDPPNEQFHANPGVLAHNPLTNGLVLRDHVILPKGIFAEVARERLGKIVGNDKVHFIDTSWYEQHQGAIHCATVVVRDPDRRIIVK